ATRRRSGDRRPASPHAWRRRARRSACRAAGTLGSAREFLRRWSARSKARPRRGRDNAASRPPSGARSASKRRAMARYEPKRMPAPWTLYRLKLASLERNLLPVFDELLQTDVGERMVCELLDDLERDRADVGSELRRLQHVRRAANARHEHLGVKPVVLVDGE